MDVSARRQEIMRMLRETKIPLAGSLLAQKLGVSRQVVVTDIAVLRATGENIAATIQGYILPEIRPGYVQEKIVCCHDQLELFTELEIILDNGGQVLDVIVEHPVYGEIKVNLLLASRDDLDEFMQQLALTKANPLSMITGGVHIHTIEAPTNKVLENIKRELRVAGILLE